MSRYRLFVDPERRLPNFHNSYLTRDELPAGTTQEVIGITASDGAASVGVLHRPAGGSRLCAMYMHPRTNQTRPYLAPALLNSGIAVWGQMSRYVNNDIDMTHEEVLLDYAAGMRWLRAQGFETIVAIGNSGGSSLAAYYQSQASQEPSKRQKLSPAGELTGFEQEEMPPFDLYVALALHLGEGTVLLRGLDPAVIDEHDPVATDPALDMYDRRNGYRDLPEESAYDPQWLAAYRKAQIERCRHLDKVAQSVLADYHEARQAADPQRLDSPLARRAMYARLMVVHRTWANPADLDLSIEPNRRPIGIIGGEHPIRANLGLHGLARVLTPRAWLSTWSGLSSKAELLETIREVRVPTLLLWPDGDIATPEGDAKAVLEAAGAESKTLHVVEWSTHYLTPTPGMPKDLASPKQRAGEAAVQWIQSQLGLARR
ncbi:MAG TPA: hypothetical protein VLJ57_12810 [Burkholderiaceae bacterium]|nr:hypothetical protein [Burkholderiaceae bacterium]